MLVQRDKEIFKHLEQYGSITIIQAGQIFFKNSIHHYDLARKRLLKLEEMSLLRHYTNHVTGEKVYYTERKLCAHDLILMNFYSNLIYHNATIKEFKKERKFMQGKVRADGFVRFSHGGYDRIIVIEVDLTHLTRLEKYEELYNSGELQTEYGVFPLIAVLGDQGKFKSNNIEVVYLDHKLRDFSQRILVI